MKRSISVILQGTTENPLKLSFIAPTGYGKTTAVNIIQNTFERVVNIKLAAPLYELQDYFYNLLDKSIEDQDGELLQFLGYKIQKESPQFLANKFYIKLQDVKEEAQIITNDDCRPHNYEFLKNLGFKFIRINGFPRLRNDHTAVDSNHPVEQGISSLASDYTIDNFDGLDIYSTNLIELVELIAKDVNKSGKEAKG